jgi:hypothetical protein
MGNCSSKPAQFDTSNEVKHAKVDLKSPNLDIHTRDEHGRTLLLRECTCTSSFARVLVLLDLGANINDMVSFFKYLFPNKPPNHHSN